MANNTIAKTTNSTMYDNRNCYKVGDVADKIILDAKHGNALPLPTISNDQTNVLACTFTSHISFDKLIELTDSEPKRVREWNAKPSTNTKRLMRLCGGGEQGINNGTTGWGSPPSAPSTTAGKKKLQLTPDDILNEF